MGTGEKEKESEQGAFSLFPSSPARLLFCDYCYLLGNPSGSLDHDRRRLPSSQHALRLFRVVSGLCDENIKFYFKFRWNFRCFKDLSICMQCQEREVQRLLQSWFKTTCIVFCNNISAGHTSLLQVYRCYSCMQWLIPAQADQAAQAHYESFKSFKILVAPCSCSIWSPRNLACGMRNRGLWSPE